MLLSRMSLPYFYPLCISSLKTRKGCSEIQSKGILFHSNYVRLLGNVHTSKRTLKTYFARKTSLHYISYQIIIKNLLYLSLAKHLSLCSDFALLLTNLYAAKQTINA